MIGDVLRFISSSVTESPLLSYFSSLTELLAVLSRTCYSFVGIFAASRGLSSSLMISCRNVCGSGGVILAGGDGCVCSFVGFGITKSAISIWKLLSSFILGISTALRYFASIFQDFSMVSDFWEPISYWTIGSCTPDEMFPSEKALIESLIMSVMWCPTKLSTIIYSSPSSFSSPEGLTRFPVSSNYPFIRAVSDDKPDEKDRSTQVKYRSTEEKNQSIHSMLIHTQGCSFSN